MVSEMIGETLKLSMVVMLVAVLSASVYAFLPDDRIPHADIIIIHEEDDIDDIILKHAGGDTLFKSDVTLMFYNETRDMKEYRLEENWQFTDQINVSNLTEMKNISEIMVVHDRGVIAQMSVNYE